LTIIREENMQAGVPGSWQLNVQNLPIALEANSGRFQPGGFF
jgi:hypothetical protein